MTTVNHWGKWIDSDTPTTGVMSIHNINFEFLDWNDVICLDCESAELEIENDDSLDEDEKSEERMMLECDSSHTRLFGDWVKDSDGKYAPDKTGEFAAIENESTVQIVWSTTISKGHNVCSPCYPGQIDLDSTGEFQAYTLPNYLLRDDN